MKSLFLGLLVFASLGFFEGFSYAIPITISFNMGGTVSEVFYTSNDFKEYVGVGVGDSFSGYFNGTYDPEILTDPSTPSYYYMSMDYIVQFDDFYWRHRNPNDSDWMWLTDGAASDSMWFGLPFDFSDKVGIFPDTTVSNFVDYSNTLFQNPNVGGNISLYFLDYRQGEIEFDVQGYLHLALNAPSPQPVPEPATLVQLGSSLFGIAVVGCMRRNKSKKEMCKA